MVDRKSPVPLYIQVKNHIISEIETGSIKIGDKLMSETEMQRFYGVTRPTIRAALAGLVAEGCLRKEHGLGTFCVAYPKKEQFINVDVITNQSDSYFYPYVLKGVSQVFEKNKCNLLLHDSSGSLSRIISFMKKILARGTDGVIIPGVNKMHPEWGEFHSLLQQYRQARIPVVSVMCAEPVEFCTSFSIDQSYGTELAAQHLIDCGHRRLLGLFQHSKKTISKYQRLSGFRRALERCPDAVGYEIVEGDDFSEEVLRLIREEHITAIQCYNDYVAVECLRLLVANGYRVPEDISLIGFDDTEIARTSIPRLTTVTHPKDYMGAEAADAILRMINNPNEQVENMMYRPGLVIRQSVRQL